MSVFEAMRKLTKHEVTEASAPKKCKLAEADGPLLFRPGD
jgi:hypothetical protein